jgi:hypothetical protein
MLETSWTTTGRSSSRGVRNGNPNAIIGRDLKKENYDHNAFTGRAMAN